MKKLLTFIFFAILINSLLYSQPGQIRKYEIFELKMKGPESGNPFIDVQLSAEFKFKNKTYYCEGFYDGEGMFKIPFMPDETGKWTYFTSSNVKYLDHAWEMTITPVKGTFNGRAQIPLPEKSYMAVRATAIIK